MNNLLKHIPYDVKETIYKVKNAVLNYTEMESKVREATNNDAWGASSTLLLEIARGTQNYQLFNEIMPMIYKRFAENQKNWRQIYKTLQLVEYLLKNGSDRVITNVRDHIFEIKTFTNYQFVDEKGKDQGVNVRHRAKEITELVQDDDRLKDERARATANRNKYAGVSADEMRYGGFSNNSAPAASSSTTSSNAGESTSYAAARTNSTSQPSASSGMPTIKMADTGSQPAATSSTTSAPKPAVQNSPNLLDFDFTAPAAAPPANTGGWGNFSQAAPVAAPAPQNDFADFQSAPAPPAAAQNSSFGQFGGSGFGDFAAAPPAANNGFGGFNASPATSANAGGFGAFNTAAAPPSNSGGWGAFNAAPPAALSAPSQPVTNIPVMSPTSSNASQPPISASTQPKKASDLLQANLAALDLLGKPNQPRTDPSLNALAQQQPPAAASPAGFGGFNNASNANGGWGNWTTAPAQTSSFGAAQPPAQQPQQQLRTGSTFGQPASPNSQQPPNGGWGSFNQAANNPNDLLL